MKKIRGIAASRGIAVGRLLLPKEMKPEFPKETEEDTAAEWARFEAAQKQAIAELQGLYLTAVEQIGKESSMIFQLHGMMLEDPDFSDAVSRRILEEHTSAEYAVQEAGKQLAAVFYSLEDEYMRGRAADVQDVCRRLLCCLRPEADICWPGRSCVPAGEPCILALPQIFPSQLLRLREQKISGVITCGGSRLSHSAILARMMGIPTVVSTGASFSALEEGKTVIVDGSTGWIYVEPEEKERKKYENALETLPPVFEVPAASGKGRTMRICATMARPEHVEEALLSGADGVGLYRSEFLCLDSAEFPDEEAQFQTYTSILKRLQGKPVTIRTLDIGADRQFPYLGMLEEENPAMGYRALRFSLHHPETFRCQLRALLRASPYGNLRILLPMVTNEQEVRQAREILEDVKTSLAQEGVPFRRDVPLGLMIETPAAALTADVLAEQADFFSIGTSDLTQFTMAADRANLRVAYLHDCRHPAVLRLIRMAAEAGNRARIPVSVCGEAASDSGLLEFFLECGVSSLVVPPGMVEGMRDALRRSGLV